LLPTGDVIRQRTNEAVGRLRCMSKASMTITISDDLSSDIASAILTRQKEWGADPIVLLDVVRTVHDTLRELSSKTDTDRKKWRAGSRC
jgi:hypothetical protein